jgi:hypothetical protein
MIQTLTEMDELETLKQITRAHIVHNEALWTRWGWFAFFSVYRSSWSTENGT